MNYFSHQAVRSYEDFLVKLTLNTLSGKRLVTLTVPISSKCSPELSTRAVRVYLKLEVKVLDSKADGRRKSAG